MGVELGLSSGMGLITGHDMTPSSGTGRSGPLGWLVGVNVRVRVRVMVRVRVRVQSARV